ncbi:MAG: hypothetical protein ACOCTT_04325 [archaeon]
MGKMMNAVKEDRGNKHAEVEGIDKMTEDELKEELKKKEYIRVRQAEIIKKQCKEIDNLKDELSELKE